MLILDKPYVSDFLKKEIAHHGWPVLNSELTGKELVPDCCTLVDDEAFAQQYVEGTSRLYCNSENAIGWISEYLAHTSLPEHIDCFKDKERFRKLTASLYPELYFKGVAVEKLDTIDASALPYPVVVKPAVGFFSMGVHRVDGADEWADVIDTISKELDSVKGLYPDAVMDGSRYLIEQCVEGEEYAVDAYYDADGNPVVLNVLYHEFSSGKDVSDRIYSTSSEIVEAHLAPFTEFLRQVGKAAGLRNFPVHAELRVDDKGRAVPIEVNPMRFAGWCTTDIAYHAWGISPYDYYFNNKRPDWQTLVNERRGNIWSLAIAELPADVKPEAVTGVEYDALAACFTETVELRRINWHEYPVLAILMARTPKDTPAEIGRFLRDDMHRYLIR